MTASKNQRDISNAGLRHGTLVKPRLRLVHGEGTPAKGRHSSSASRSSRAVRAQEFADASKSSTIRGRAELLTQQGRSGVHLERKRGLARRKVATIVSAAVLAFVVFVVVAGQVFLAQAGYSKSSAEKELDQARAEYERARLEEAEAKLPQRVEQRARGELGLSDAPLEEPLQMGPSVPPGTGDFGPSSFSVPNSELKADNSPSRFDAQSTNDGDAGGVASKPGEIK